MQTSSFTKAGILMLIIVLAFFVGWEMHLRNKGIKIAYDDGESLWADKRAMVYEPSDKATVFIGSSRNKFDLDIATWQKLTGDHAIQLAIEGNSPLPVLADLAGDEHFKGKLIIDVTEGLFFSTSPQNTAEPAKRVAYYKKRTPAQRFSFLVNHQLENGLVFLNKDHLSLNALLEELPIPKRKGVFALPNGCPMEFNACNFERQCIMTERFEKDTTLQKQVTGLWDFYRKISKDPPPDATKTDSMIAIIRKDIDKIKARGGQVIFVRSPSSGPYWQGEQQGFPRPLYWDKILAATEVKGIHFKDYPAIDHFECPEFSHLKQSDAIVYTQNLAKILEQEKGWKFAKSPITAN